LVSKIACELDDFFLLISSDSNLEILNSVLRENMLRNFLSAQCSISLTKSTGSLLIKLINFATRSLVTPKLFLMFL